MPPKKTFNRDEESDDDSTVDTSSSEDEVQPPKRTSAAPASTTTAQAQQGGGRGVMNRPHDEEYDVGHDEAVKTPPRDAQRQPSFSTTTATVTPASKSGGTMLRNNPNDETFDVVDDRPIQTPPKGAPAKAAPKAAPAPGGSKTGVMKNNPFDEFENVDDDVDTPPRQAASQQMQGGGQRKPGSLNTQSLGSRQVSNDHHDEAIDVSDHSQGTPASTYGSATPQSAQKSAGSLGPQKTLAPQGKMSMIHRDESSSDDDEERGASGSPQGAAGAKSGGQASKPPPTQEYNPADYAAINQRASREMQELFLQIASYQPVMQELPSKLRPFIPDFIPTVGDLDPFCKIPRPDSRPDNLGLTVVDEPCANQSNPAVVKISLQYYVRGRVPTVFVDSVENAASRPNVIDKWVADIKKVHYKKPLTSVNYSKPMPEIESLLQVWPQEFEELLNSDLQFPPTQVDLDIDQYVRVMCAVLDIPTYGSLIESLHVMFTLYCEFRANQHFQHA